MNPKNVCNRSYPVLPIAVREEFPVVDATYRSEDYTANVSFSEPNMITLGYFIVVSVPRSRI